MKKYLAEFLGTFGLVFIGTGSIVVNQETGALGHLGISINFGLVVTAMIYTFGSISGAHLNPVVSVCMTITRHFQAKEIAPYIIAQLLGALTASFALHLLFPSNTNLGMTLPTGSDTQSFILEIIITYLLILIIYFIANSENEKYIGFIIGGVVLFLANFAGPISGASMNPTRSLAPAIVAGNLDKIIIYLTAPFVGGILASFTWLFFKSKEDTVQK